jgi:DNA-binding LytR/AlgR family response regulator
MEDHYAVIQTSKGEHRVLMRLKDAIDLLEGLPGLQVHRSHWVPINAMIALHKEQRKYLLEIKSGKSIPVSQSYLEAVQSILK